MAKFFKGIIFVFSSVLLMIFVIHMLPSSLKLKFSDISKDIQYDRIEFPEDSKMTTEDYKLLKSATTKVAENIMILIKKLNSFLDDGKKYRENYHLSKTEFLKIAEAGKKYSINTQYQAKLDMELALMKELSYLENYYNPKLDYNESAIDNIEIDVEEEDSNIIIWIMIIILLDIVIPKPWATTNVQRYPIVHVCYELLKLIALALIISFVFELIKSTLNGLISDN